MSLNENNSHFSFFVFRCSNFKKEKKKEKICPIEKNAGKVHRLWRRFRSFRVQVLEPTLEHRSAD